MNWNVIVKNRSIYKKVMILIFINGFNKSYKLKCYKKCYSKFKYRILLRILEKINKYFNNLIQENNNYKHGNQVCPNLNLTIQINHIIQ